MRWGTITGTSPLRVRLDGDTDPLPFTPDSLIDPLILELGDRVRCEVSGRVVIVGKAGGLPLPIASDTGAGIVELATPAETTTGTADNLAVTPEGLATFAGRPMIPSSVVVGSGSATVADDGTVSFTGASSVSLNDVFDGLGADCYAVVGSIETSTGSTVSTRLRAGGTDLAGTDYSRTGAYTQLATGPTRLSSSSANSFGFWVLTSAGSVSSGDGVLHVFRPKQVGPTRALFRSVSFADSDLYDYSESTRVASGEYDGLSVIADAGTITGTLKVVKIA